MATRLRSLLQAPPFTLAFRTALFAVVYAWTRGGFLHFFPTLLFLAVAVVLYVRTQAHRPRELLIPFIVFLASAMILTPFLEHALPFFFLVFIFSGVWFGFLGVRELVFLDRIRAHLSINLVLIWVLILGFFTTEQVVPFMLRHGILLVILFLLVRDIVMFFARRGNDIESMDRAFAPRMTLMASVLTLVAAEAVWVFAILPFTPLYAAGMAALSLFLALDICSLYLLKNLKISDAIIRFVIFFILSFVLFFAAHWSIS